jgi:Undecaprenyl-phosphate galactose phosphotransferase WbaP
MIRATFTLLKQFVVSILLCLSDVFIIASCFVISYFIRSILLVNYIPLFQPIQHSINLYLAAWPVLALWLIIFAYEGLYPSIGISYWEEVFSVQKSNFTAFVILVVLSFITRTSVNYSRPVIIIAFFISVIMLPVGRKLMRTFLIKTGLWTRDVILVGSAEDIHQVVCNLRKHPDFGLKPLGAFIEGGKTNISGIEIYGEIKEIPQKRIRADEVIVALRGASSERLTEIVEISTSIAPVVHIIPDLYGLASTGVTTHDLDGMLLLEMEDRLARLRNRTMKKAFDIAMSVIALIIFSPVFLAIVIIIKMDSRGPSVFGHKRVGKGGSAFTCYKFRTMVVNAQEVLQDLLQKDPEAKQQWDQDFKLKDDPRITRIGSLLRKTSLDELPQLFNVLKGEMSLVGPRPIVEEEIGRYGNKAKYFFKVTPGITGLWQVSGRNDIDYDERVMLDEYYAKNWSLWLDIEIIIRTFGAVLKKEGAY